MHQAPIVHVSFDFWRTLFKSNPQFSRARVALLQENFNPNKLSDTQISAIIENIGDAVDNINKITLESVSASEMNAALLLKMGIHPIPNVLKDFEKKVTDLFIHFPPHLIASDTDSIFERLGAAGVTISLASNTAFICGDVLDTILSNAKLSNHFLFKVYSDKINRSKPASDFFSSVYQTATALNKNVNDKDSILHVGDDFHADIEGAKNFGFSFFQINSNGASLNDIFNETNNFGI
jgi:putative hydrolase of the HAD superfamily